MCNRHPTLTLATGLAILLAAGGAPRAQGQCEPQWLPGEGFPGLDRDAHAAVVYDDGSGPALYVGGEFTIAGDVFANNIARWDGTSWSPLGSGMNGQVRALTVYNGDLIAGGNFTTAGDVFANNIARWDGTSWSVLGSGMDGQVRALTVYNGDLIAGGYFETAGGTPANHVARWDGATWSALGSGMSGGYEPSASALTVHDGELIA
ncbi:MAG: hypothetical protein GY778_05485, partial [bacterium]|nr:hypothetical protein [bacterium]